MKMREDAAIRQSLQGNLAAARRAFVIDLYFSLAEERSARLNSFCHNRSLLLGYQNLDSFGCQDSSET